MNEANGLFPIQYMVGIVYSCQTHGNRITLKFGSSYHPVQPKIDCLWSIQKFNNPKVLNLRKA